METRSFLVLHGVENHRPAGHWQYELVQRLREDGEQVLYPQLPDADGPSLTAWVGAIEAELEKMRGERVVICHSLACAAWFHLAAANREAPAADRLLLVSPPGPSTFTWDVIAGFAPASLELAGLRLAAQPPRLAYSDNDPYCSEDAATIYGEPLRCDIDLLSGAGHITPADGYGPWPSARNWCLDPTTRLTVNG
ncbi:alpha/beta hydrolase [Streptomyces sp. NBC_01476]|uniref:RBBP9/YdeN family alpha/beta hydrolase n=1 Tax=Streptomyces sp. NBC_01476 TaxID=2903881 RepID=UPI002E34064A|nr:alpha/beta hydrolase [Streptomyces sp. NBC_01476]